jgi:hypothetical protein
LPFFSSIRRSSRSRSASTSLRSSWLPGKADVKSSRLQGFEPSVESTSYSRCFHLLARVASLGFSFCKGPDSHWLLRLAFFASLRRRFGFGEVRSSVVS